MLVRLYYGNAFRLLNRRLVEGRLLRLLGVMGWGQLCDMRVLDGPLNVFL